MLLSIYDIEENLTKVSDAMFSISNKKSFLKNGITLGQEFDFINSETVGFSSVLGLSANEMFESENLQFQKQHIGRDAFSIFLTLAIQCGYARGRQSKDEEIENSRLQQNQMPDGDLAQEVIKLRDEMDSIRLELRYMNELKLKLSNISKISQI